MRQLLKLSGVRLVPIIKRPDENSLKRNQNFLNALATYEADPRDAMRNILAKACFRELSHAHIYSLDSDKYAKIWSLALAETEALVQREESPPIFSLETMAFAVLVDRCPPSDSDRAHQILKKLREKRNLTGEAPFQVWIMQRMINVFDVRKLHLLSHIERALEEPIFDWASYNGSLRALGLLNYKVPPGLLEKLLDQYVLTAPTPPPVWECLSGVQGPVLRGEKEYLRLAQKVDFFFASISRSGLLPKKLIGLHLNDLWNSPVVKDHTKLDSLLWLDNLLETYDKQFSLIPYFRNLDSVSGGIHNQKWNNLLTSLMLK